MFVCLYWLKNKHTQHIGNRTMGGERNKKITRLMLGFFVIKPLISKVSTARRKKKYAD